MKCDSCPAEGVREVLQLNLSHWLCEEHAREAESPCCAEPLVRPNNAFAKRYSGVQWCAYCWTPYDMQTGRVARKACLGCDATLELSDPDICLKCDQHGIIIVNGKAYAPIR